MKAWLDELINEKAELQIAPLIDVVFLLLIYFMVTSSLKRSEADLSMSLPSSVTLTKQLKMPDEQIIEVRANGAIVLNARQYERGDKTGLAELEQTLTRFREASQALQTEPMITIAAEDNAVQQRVIDAMNACAGAKISSVTFGSLD